MYVADREANLLIRIDPKSDWRTVAGGAGWGTETFDQPCGIVTDGLSVLVADYGNHRVQRFDLGLHFVSAFETRASSEESQAKFGFPLDVGISSQSELFVLERENNRVVKFFRDNSFKFAFGATGTPGQRLRNPRRMCVGSSDEVYVLDQSNLLEFDAFGTFVRSIPLGDSTEPLSFRVADSAFIILRPNAVQWYSHGGSLIEEILLKNVPADVPIRDPQDITVSGDKLFLLTLKKLLVFQVVKH